MKIDEIIDLLGTPPPAQQINHDEQTFNEVVKVYHEMYAPGLSSFFESTWYYFVENGQMTFPKNPKLIERMATFLKILEGVKANDLSLMASSGILETRLVWDLSRTCYDAPDMPNSATAPSVLPQDGNPKEAKNRVQAVEALLCGEYLVTNPLTPPYHDADTQRTRQYDFWYNLAEFVRSRNDLDAPSTAKFREDVLARMRHLLDGRENRDVLYSIAVVRQLAPCYDPAQQNGVALPQHFDESDPRHRLAVASKFIYDQSRVTGGTTNTVRRFSDIASRAFVNPGVNVTRQPTP
ncbi:Fc.00g063160.m01.CDS01 [Cosmosporella sp. VM-42]